MHAILSAKIETERVTDRERDWQTKRERDSQTERNNQKGETVRVCECIKLL